MSVKVGEVVERSAWVGYWWLFAAQLTWIAPRWRYPGFHLRSASLFSNLRPGLWPYLSIEWREHGFRVWRVF